MKGCFWHVCDDRGGARRLCPGSSDIDLFSYGESIIDFDAEIPDSALALGVAQQQLDGTQITGSTVDECCLGPPERMGAEEVWIKADRRDPPRDQPSILSGSCCGRDCRDC